MRGGCTCPQPRISPNPRLAGSCVVCGKLIAPELLEPDERLTEFFDRLEGVVIASAGRLPETFAAFRRQCKDRESAGRGEFGLSFLSRDNLAEGREEAADGAIYSWLEALKLERCGEDPDLQLALSEAFHLFKFYEANLERSARRAR